MLSLEQGSGLEPRCPTRAVAAVLLGCSLVWAGAAYGAAGFSLNWNPNPTLRTGITFADYINCNRGVNANCFHEANGDFFAPYTNPSNSVTPFLQESVVINNQRYYHVIVGALDANNAGFAIEYYISALTAGMYPGTKAPGYLYMGSASGGASHPIYVRDPLNSKDSWKSALNNGTGTANPEKVLMRMRLTDQDPAAFSLDIVKDQFATKPKITQTTGDATWSAVVQIDGSTLSYSDAVNSAPFVNRVTLSDPALRGSGDFDMGTDARNITLSAGRYTYKPGALLNIYGAPILDANGNAIPWTGVPVAMDDPSTPAVETQIYGREGAGGAYTYGTWDAQFKMGSIDWKFFRVPAQNP